jgi:hypothetical protein
MSILAPRGFRQLPLPNAANVPKLVEWRIIGEQTKMDLALPA